MVDVSNIPDFSPLKCAYEDTADDLNSSPIKDLNSDDFRESPHRQFLSSPIKRKCVAFSDDLFLDVPSSPDPRLTPKKSILKPFNISHTTPDPNDTSLWNTAYHNPAHPDFWVQGTILQLPSNSAHLQQMVLGCILVLKEPSFDKRFEVYATLNNLYKTNNNDTLLRLFTIAKPIISNLPMKNQRILSPLKNSYSPSRSPRSPKSLCALDESNYIIELSSIIKNEILTIEQELFKDQDNINPFRIRVINQALKLMTSFMLDQELNNFLPLDEVKWYYRHSCAVLVKVRTSKALVSPYLALIKDCRFNSKRKKILLDSTDIPETMLYTLLNMQSFVSSSLVTEKFVCFKNFVANFPGIMAKNINHWFPVFLLNLCSLPSQLYAKCIGVGINCLLEIAKAFLDNKVVLAGVNHFLSSTITGPVRSISSDSSLELDSETGFDYISARIHEMLDIGVYKSAMEIWVAVTLLIGESGFDSWPFLTRWLKIQKLCFDSEDINAKIVSIHSWRAVVYNVCHNDLDDLKKTVEPIMRQYPVKDRNQAITTALKQKIRLVTYPFLTLDVSVLQKEVIDLMHHLFLSILYSLLNPSSIKLNPKYLHIYWDKIVQPVLLNFYFKRGISELYLNQLGVMILSRLMKTAMPISERNFNELRCLASEPVSINEINSLPPRWIYAKFDRIIHNILMVFQLEKLPMEQKLTYFTTFLSCIKLTTKKEVQPSDSTLDIIEYIPHVFEALFKKNKLSYDAAFKLIINLHDTFSPSSLVYRLKNGTSLNVYTVIIRNCVSSFPPEHLRELLTLVVSSISDKKMLMVMFDLYSMENVVVRDMVMSVLNSRPIDLNELELRLCGDLCRLLTSGFELFVKKLIQSVVGNLNTEEVKRNLEYLNVPSWSIQTFKYFVFLVHDAPSPHIQNFTLRTISQRLQDEMAFVEVTRYLYDNQYDPQLLALKDDILMRYNSLMNGFSKFDFALVWRAYLERAQSMDDLLTSTLKYTDIDIKPYIRNNWDNLPLLKELWLTTHDTLYIDENYIEEHIPDSMEIEEEGEGERENEEDQIDVESIQIKENVVEDIEEGAAHEENVGHREEETAHEEVDDHREQEAVHEEKDRHGEQETGHQDEQKEVIEELNEGQELEELDETIQDEHDVGSIDAETVLDENPPEVVLGVEETPRTRRRKKSKSPEKSKAKSKRKSKKKEETKEVILKEISDEIKQVSSFDIHSFTALLNAKLTVPEVKKTKRKKRETKKEVKNPKPIEISQVVDISDDSIATDSLDVESPEAQKESVEKIDDSDSFGSNGVSSKNSAEYGQMLENGFSEHQTKRGTRRLKRKQAQKSVSSKKQKREREEADQIPKAEVENSEESMAADVNEVQSGEESIAVDIAEEVQEEVENPFHEHKIEVEAVGEEPLELKPDHIETNEMEPDHEISQDSGESTEVQDTSDVDQATGNTMIGEDTTEDITTDDINEEVSNEDNTENISGMAEDANSNDITDHATDTSIEIFEHDIDTSNDIIDHTDTSDEVTHTTNSYDSTGHFTDTSHDTTEDAMESHDTTENAIESHDTTENVGGIPALVNSVTLAHPSHPPHAPLSYLADHLSGIADHQIEKMTKAEIYRLETELMTFMYRIRNIAS